ncbi:LLM class flavin-dependent oxidoreductase [Labedaea rhizosphaerae]|uniref:Alkanesulfonate monooxygenase SsuD/methylene tetrahydromethanopterin reductase-like flavin-dependent oxidoreductase (Luciferase family) n=1 Tax=Labedaea rhizosphaerae TaxID=598644 RepID=A0A4R6RQA9_LABRH|nr:LLM class flavin-dependent oxidoreductase [Labedaea rhizosphaerae]TDP88971.1 alkanesulfonate monooxygenase SsuD/methylene tetrahydromethanopterin reductase-like flavin-dependent oxidoreductase (luciferase family) [Labedaea rhizosphaerae]
MSELRFGYLLPTFADVPLESLVDLGVRAEQAGFDSLWVPDSPFVYGLPDPLVLLSALAARTDRITLATGVLLAVLRRPLLLAHSLATLDRLAGRRLLVGLGGGFGAPETERQFAAAGVDFRGRGARLTETIETMRTLWSGAPVDGITLSPAPETKGGPPIWLAGASAAAQRRVGELADGWLPYPPTVAGYVQGRDRIRAAAEHVGRVSPTGGLYLTVALDPSVDVARKRLRSTVEGWYGRPFEVVSSFQAMFAGTEEGFRDWLAPYLAAGVEHVVVRVADDDPARGLDTAAALL